MAPIRNPFSAMLPHRLLSKWRQMESERRLGKARSEVLRDFCTSVMGEVIHIDEWRDRDVDKFETKPPKK